MTVRVKHLTVEHRLAVALLTFFLLRQAKSHFMRLVEVEEEAPVCHVTIIDGAPQVVGSNKRIERELIGILQEVRKLGEGIFLVCRNTSISRDILQETNQKIAHRLDKGDVDSIAKTLGLREKDFLGSLPPWSCLRRYRWRAGGLGANSKGNLTQQEGSLKGFA